MPAPIEKGAPAGDVRPRGHFHWPTFAADAGLVTGGALFANALNYVFHFILSRRLGPEGYGELATLLAVIMVVGVVGSAVGTLAMQETARLWASHRDDDVHAFWRKALAWAAAVAAVIGLAMFALARPLSYFLHIADWTAWTALAVALFVGIIAAAARGAAQGAHRFALFAASLVTDSSLKLILGFALAVAGFGAGGALWGVTLGLTGGGAVAALPMLARSLRTRVDFDPAQFIAPALRLSTIYAASTALLYIDLVFAKHALDAADAGFYSAAGLIARIIPFGAGLIVPLVTPKAVAARVANRAQLSHLLVVSFVAVAGGIACVLAVMELWPKALILTTFGATFAPAAPLLRLYALDGALIAFGLVGYSYLAGIGDYAIAAWLVAALVGEAICMAAFGNTPWRLLTIAIVGNAAVLPAVAIHVARSLREAPQATGGRFAEQTLTDRRTIGASTSMSESARSAPAPAAGHVFYRKLHRAMPRIVRGKGVWLFDDAGNRYLDGSGGAMVANVGHGVEEIAAAVGAQAASVAYVNGTVFTNEPAEALADLLAAKAPEGVDKAYFLSSGSEAVEAALKLARQYHVERGEPARSTIVARTPGYHGNTLLALSVSAREHYKKFYAPWLLDVVMIDAPYPYRAGAAGDRSPAMTGDALETAILAAGPGNVAAFIAEPIGGSSTGASVPPPAYYARVREICDRYGVLFVADEVLTGAGRTGKFLALEHFKGRDGKAIVPDIVTMGKGLNGGYAPLSAMLVKSSIVDVVAGGSGNFQHAQTYSHNPLAAAAGLATMRYLEKHELVARAARMGPILLDALRTTLASSEGAALVGDVRGIGMLAAVEIVADTTTKRAFARSLKVAERLTDAALAQGLVVWPNVGHADGSDGDLVMIAPAFTISEEEIHELAGRLSASLDDLARQLAKTPA